jgi:MEMO1 family protein
MTGLAPNVREPAVAGTFYPSDPHDLYAAIERLLSAAPARATAGCPLALIVPHAGYVYSGAIAAATSRLLLPWRQHIRRVVLIGPPHRLPVPGAATLAVDGFRTPLGDVPVDRDSVKRLLEHAAVRSEALAHRDEHALEVQLPFLQVVLEHFVLVPLLIGELPATTTAALLEPWWAAPHTLLVVSTDLSHFHPDTEARTIDAATDAAIIALDDRAIGPQQACGCRALNGLLHLARAHGATVDCLARGNSSATTGSRDRVVGYAAYTVQ